MEIDLLFIDYLSSLLWLLQMHMGIFFTWKTTTEGTSSEIYDQI